MSQPVITLHVEELNQLENGHPLVFGDIIVATTAAADRHGLLANRVLILNRDELDRLRAGMDATLPMLNGDYVNVNGVRQ